MYGIVRERERERERDWNSKTVFYKDCGLGQPKAVRQLVFAKLLMKKSNKRKNPPSVIYMKHLNE